MQTPFMTEHHIATSEDGAGALMGAGFRPVHALSHRLVWGEIPPLSSTATFFARRLQWADQHTKRWTPFLGSDFRTAAFGEAGDLGSALAADPTADARIIWVDPTANGWLLFLQALEGLAPEGGTEEGGSASVQKIGLVAGSRPVGSLASHELRLLARAPLWMSEQLLVDSMTLWRARQSGNVQEWTRALAAWPLGHLLPCSPALWTEAMVWPEFGRTLTSVERAALRQAAVGSSFGEIIQTLSLTAEGRPFDFWELCMVVLSLVVQDDPLLALPGTKVDVARLGSSVDELLRASVQLTPQGRTQAV